MKNVRVKLLRPLNGADIGSEATYAPADAKRLEGHGAVEILGDEPEDTEPAEKASPAPENKAEPAAPANKASKPAKGK